MHYVQAVGMLFLNWQLKIHDAWLSICDFQLTYEFSKMSVLYPQKSRKHIIPHTLFSSLGRYEHQYL